MIMQDISHWEMLQKDASLTDKGATFSLSRYSS